MSSLTSLTKAVTGLSAAQKGLQVTGHSISNANTKGYTRQQLLQSDSAYLTIGNKGGYALQVGLGVTQDEIRQIRDDLADKRLRTENSVLCYYQKLNGTVSDIESIFDEPYGDTISAFLNNFWSQAQKLNTSPSGVEERQSFISSAKVLIDKITDVSKGLTDYQSHLNREIVSGVQKVNDILKEISTYNEKICIAEANGDAANDYRDQRNLLLDELSAYGDISYYEEADSQVQVKFEGHIVVNKGFVAQMETSNIEKSPYKQVVWAGSREAVFDLSKASSASMGNDSGSLKAMLIARGEQIATGTEKWEEIALDKNKSVDVTGNAYVIPKIQKMLSEFSSRLATLVNESFSGTGIGTHKGEKGVEVFIPINSSDAEQLQQSKLKVTAAEQAVGMAQKEVKKFEEGTPEREAAEAALKVAQEDLQTVKESYYKEMEEILVAGNVKVNPELLEGGGYNKLGTVQSAGSDWDDNRDNSSDNTLVSEFLTKWNTAKDWFGGEETTKPYQKSATLSGFFSELVTGIGAEGAIYTTKANEKNISVISIENERQAMGAVSTDEEFSNLMKYQYAYNASARMITMLDGMLDTVINRL